MKVMFFVEYNDERMNLHRFNESDFHFLMNWFMQYQEV